MTEIGDWVHYLRGIGLEAFIMNGADVPTIVGASKVIRHLDTIESIQSENPFLIYFEQHKWICHIAGPGQMYTIINAADLLEDACKSIVGYLELVKTDKSVPAKLLISLWRLQERGYTIKLLDHEHITVRKNSDSPSAKNHDYGEIVVEKTNGTWTSSFFTHADADSPGSLETLLDTIR